MRTFWLYKQKISSKWHCFETLSEAERKRLEHTKEWHSERGFELFEVIQKEQQTEGVELRLKYHDALTRIAELEAQQPDVSDKNMYRVAADLWREHAGKMGGPEFTKFVIEWRDKNSPIIKELQKAQKALDLATDLLNIPEQHQDDDWTEKNKQVGEALSRIDKFMAGLK